MSRQRRATAPTPAAWSEPFQEWKITALRRLLQELEHICAGPRSRPKGYCIEEALHNVIARDFDPSSLLGCELTDILLGTLSQQVIARTDLHARLTAGFPGTPEVPLEFLPNYVNARWWLDAFLHLETTTCFDLLQLVNGAIAATDLELLQERGALA